MGNGALPNGRSYRAHPRLYHFGPRRRAKECLLMEQKQTLEISICVPRLRASYWRLGVTDRSPAASPWASRIEVVTLESLIPFRGPQPLRGRSEAHSAQLPLGSPRRELRCPWPTIMGLSSLDLAPTRSKTARAPSCPNLLRLHHCEQTENQGPSDSTLGQFGRVSGSRLSRKP